MRKINLRILDNLHLQHEELTDTYTIAPSNPRSIVFLSRKLWYSAFAESAQSRSKVLSENFNLLPQVFFWCLLEPELQVQLAEVALGRCETLVCRQVERKINHCWQATAMTQTLMVGDNRSWSKQCTLQMKQSLDVFFHLAELAKVKGVWLTFQWLNSICVGSHIFNRNVANFCFGVK